MIKQITASLLLLSLIGPAVADTCYWVGTTTSWNTASNWSTGSGGAGGTCDGGTVPDSNDDVIFNTGGTSDCVADVAITINSYRNDANGGKNMDFSDNGYIHSVLGNWTTAYSNTDVGNSIINISGDASFGSMQRDNGATIDLVGTSKDVTFFSDFVTTVKVSGSYTLKGTRLFAGILEISGTLVGNRDIRANTFIVTSTGSAAIRKADTQNRAEDAVMIVQSGGSLTASSEYECNFKSLCVFGGDVSGFTDLRGGIGNKTFRFDDGSTVPDLNGAPFNMTVDTVTNNASINVTGDIIMDSGDSWAKGTGTITAITTANKDWDFSGESVENIDIDCATCEVRLSAGVTADSLTISSGAIDIDGQVFSSIGNFVAGAGAIIKDTAASGSFDIGGNIDINGTSGNNAVWTDANISQLAAGVNKADYCAVANSNNSSGNSIDCSLGCIDNGGNFGWVFGAPPVIKAPLGLQIIL